MSAYEALAGCYDAFTGDVDYGRRADFLEKLMRRSRIPVRTVLDLACGTGTMTALLMERGYELIAVDGSADMLALAREKAAGRRGIPPLFLQQEMPGLDLYGTVEAAVCCLDSLNYLTRPRDLRRTLAGCGVLSGRGASRPSTSSAPAISGSWTARCSWTKRRTPTACGGRSTKSAANAVLTIWTFF